MSAEEKQKARKKPFKWTRELIKLALNDGWTQQEIAGKCRTYQSVVSEWKNGSKLGTEQQLKPLLDIYGHRLRRNTFKVYWSIDNETQAKTFYKVEGKVIFSHVFFDLARDPEGRLRKKIPQLKLAIHHQSTNKFVIALQTRIHFNPSNYLLEHSIEDAIWTSQIVRKDTIQDLINSVDHYAENTLKDHFSDALTLPFLIRQALLNHGLPVEGIVEFPAPW